MSDPTSNTLARTDGLHCVYGTCRGIPNSPHPCNPGCYFQGSSVSETEILRRLLGMKEVTHAN
jgi:hypothetical protein